jgi:hypothetical protein
VERFPCSGFYNIDLDSVQHFVLMRERESMREDPEGVYQSYEMQIRRHLRDGCGSSEVIWLTLAARKASGQFALEQSENRPYRREGSSASIGLEGAACCEAYSIEL